jgi:hypothetical protein
MMFVDQRPRIALGYAISKVLGFRIWGNTHFGSIL